MKCTRLGPGHYRLDERLSIISRAVGPVDIDAGYEWHVGLEGAAWPWPSEAMLLASLVHDRAYDFARSAAWLRRADAAFVEVYTGSLGSTLKLIIIWPLLRARARWVAGPIIGEIS